jgi:hypothetical protein
VIILAYPRNRSLNKRAINMMRINRTGMTKLPGCQRSVHLATSTVADNELRAITKILESLIPKNFKNNKNFI